MNLKIDLLLLLIEIQNKDFKKSSTKAINIKKEKEKKIIMTKDLIRGIRIIQVIKVPQDKDQTIQKIDLAIIDLYK